MVQSRNNHIVAESSYSVPRESEHGRNCTLTVVWYHFRSSVVVHVYMMGVALCKTCPVGKGISMTAALHSPCDVQFNLNRQRKGTEITQFKIKVSVSRVVQISHVLRDHSSSCCCCCCEDQCSNWNAVGTRVLSA